MVNLYEKPAYYSDFTERQVDVYTVIANESKIISVCAYKTQLYINRHYGAGGLSQEELKDMIQEVVINLMHDIEKYTDKNLAVPFWAYISEWIKYHAYEAYHQRNEKLGASTHVIRMAKKVADIMKENNWGVQETAKQLKFREDTVKKYLRLANGIESLDAKNEDDLDLYSKLGMEDEEPETDEEDIDVEAFIRDMFPGVITSNEDAFIVTTYLKNKLIDKKTCRKKTIEECEELGVNPSTTKKVIARFGAIRRNKDF